MQDLHVQIIHEGHPGKTKPCLAIAQTFHDVKNNLLAQGILRLPWASRASLITYFPRTESVEVCLLRRAPPIRASHANTKVAPKRKTVVACIALLVVLIICGIDGFLNGNKIYDGVVIGDVSVGGLTKDEAIDCVSGEYSQRFPPTWRPSSPRRKT